MAVKMISAVERITPDVASRYLERQNPMNRGKKGSVSEQRVALYASIMRAGRWLLTHQGIAFTEDGMLYDGHHRLHAVVEAGVAVDMMVTRGCSVDSLRGVDKGFARNAGQEAAMFGGPDKALRMIAKNWLQIVRRTNRVIADFECEDMASRLTPYWHSVQHGSALRGHVGIRIGMIACQVMYPTHASNFVSELVSAQRREILGSSGCRNLLRWMQTQRRGGLDLETICAGAVIQGFEQHLNGGDFHFIHTEREYAETKIMKAHGLVTKGS